MIADFGMTQISVGLEDALEGEEFGWSIRLGTCGDPGEPIAPQAAFEDFEIDETGEGGIHDVPLMGQLRNDLEYAAQIHQSAGENGGVDILACGVMEPVG